MSHHHAASLGRYLADVPIGSGPPTENTASQTPASTGNATDESGRKNSYTMEPYKGWARSSLWPWPALAVAIIALAGYLFGWLGAVVAAGQAVASLLFVAGDTLLDLKRRTWLAVSAVVVGAAVVLVLLWQTQALGFVRSRSPSPVSGPTDLVGRTVTQTMLKGLILRGAMLSGTKLDYLSLASKSLNGVVAPGSSFIGSDLRGVPMRGAEFAGADFSGACLRGADLAGAQLNGANITGADITGVDLPPSIMRTLIGKPTSPGTHVRSCQ